MFFSKPRIKIKKIDWTELENFELREEQKKIEKEIIERKSKEKKNRESEKFKRIKNNLLDKYGYEYQVLKQSFKRGYRNNKILCRHICINSAGPEITKSEEITYYGPPIVMLHVYEYDNFKIAICNDCKIIFLDTCLYF